MSTQKRIIFILGGKGGTGKTLYCLVLYYFLVLAGVKVVGLDADIENSEFMKFHVDSEHPVRRLDFLETGEAKEFFSILETETPDVVLVDMPGASAVGTRTQFDNFGAFEIAQQLGYRITIATVMNNNYNSISSLLAMMQHCEDQVDYVVVKNLLFAQGTLNFQRWEDSSTRKEMLKLKGVELEMPLFEPSTVDAMQSPPISFFQKGTLPFGDRILVDSFLSRSRAEFHQAVSYLGLPWEVPADDSKRSKHRSKKKPAADENSTPNPEESQFQTAEVVSGS